MDAPSMSGRCNLFLAQTDRAYRVVGDGSRDGLVGLMSSLDRPSIRFPSIYLYGWVGYCRGGIVEREKKISPKSLIITIFLATQKMKELLD
ncbi:hypothetical protein MTR_4g053185 [Medicago truncatula]|uniref:Uncharacterized protein n=1 Tax=Medicago truncatula TaxID=3880 RepID=A0A072UKG7_MEDTR|nr:hypothetical protein MTR_4g053185 [Medicago truncatula]